MNLHEAIDQKTAHRSPRFGLLAHLRGRPKPCRQCGRDWPCPPYRAARDVVLTAVREAQAWTRSGDLG